MVATTSLSELPERVERFDRVQRVAHWANAVLFGIAMATAAALYIGSLSALVGRRELVKDIHVIAGLALPVPLVVAAVGRWGHAFRRDLSRLNRWTRDDVRWLRSWSRDPLVRAGKFNAGQKLNAAFTGGAILLLLATGSIMKWFDPFPLTWRTGATFVHDWIAFFLFITIAGHIVYALRDSDAMRSMWRGWIPSAWVEHHAPLWHDELSREAEAAPPAAHSSARPSDARDAG